MLRARLTRLGIATSLMALLAQVPALAQDKAPEVAEVVPPNVISMPKAGPSFDAPPVAKAPQAVDVVPPNQIAMPTAGPSFDAPPVAKSPEAQAPKVALESVPTPVPAAPPQAAEPQPATPPVVATPAPTPPPAFALANEIDQRLKRERVTATGERQDRDAADKFYDARKGEPLWVTADGPTAKAKALAAEISQADIYALDAKAFRLPKLDGSNTDLADVEVTLTLAALKYARHARGGRMEPTQLSPFIDRKAQLLPAGEVLAGLAKAEQPATYLAGLNPSAKGFHALKDKLAEVRAGRQRVEFIDTAAAAPVPPPSGKAKSKKPLNAEPKGLSPQQLERKIIANMEMWRWLPDLGAYYIQANVPEYQFRVVRNGQVVHQERMVVGKNQTQTPLFSETMKVLVFKPVWNVPNGIKIRDLLPQLARNRGALTKAGLRANYNGREVDPSTVDFSTVDIRNLHIFQPSGPSNAMGQVKFLFPNKHDIYFHDTPLKPLFNESVRTLSNGCMRVRDPLKFAELILANDKGWDRSRINTYLTDRAPDNQEVRLSQPVPVHITYFTTWVDDKGDLKLANDVYGHEQRVHMGMEGKAHLIPKPQRLEQTMPVLLERRPNQQQQPNDFQGWVKQLFSF
ncbi:MAG: hypothetical protein RL291_850 [Pseudomonadota bacterium]